MPKATVEKRLYQQKAANATTVIHETIIGKASNPISAPPFLEVGSTTKYVRMDGQHPHYAIWGGNTDPTQATFSLTRAGFLKATSANIGGLTVDSNKIAYVYDNAGVDQNRAIFSSTGYISFGAPAPTSYGANVGVWIGIDSNVAKFSFYGGATNYLDWNGTDLTVYGKVYARAGQLIDLDVIGTLNVSTSGVIKSGATGFLVDDGYWLAYNGGTPQFRIGTVNLGALVAGVSWNGSALAVAGAITATSGSITGTLSITGNGKIDVASKYYLNADKIYFLENTGLIKWQNSALGYGDSSIYSDGAGGWYCKLGGSGSSSSYHYILTSDASATSIRTLLDTSPGRIVQDYFIGTVAKGTFSVDNSGMAFSGFGTIGLYANTMLTAKADTYDFTDSTGLLSRLYMYEVGGVKRADLIAYRLMLNWVQDDVTSSLVFGRSTGGNATISWNGTVVGIDKGVTIIGAVTASQIIAGPLDQEEGAADPAAPTAGYRRVFARDSGGLMTKDDAGNTYALAFAGGEVTLLPLPTVIAATKSGAFSDSDSDADGFLGVDGTDGRIYFRYGSNWYYVARLITQTEMNLTAAASATKQAVRYDEFSTQHVAATGAHGDVTATSLGVGISPLVKLHTLHTDAGTTDIVTSVIFGRNSAGTPGTGFGTSLAFTLESSTTDDQDVGAISFKWAEATHASRRGKGQLTAFYTTTERVWMDWTAGEYAVSGFIYGTLTTNSQIISTLAGGAAPFSVSNNIKVTNLNADLLDGLHSIALAILAGQAGGQTLYGGTAANEDLTLEGTSHGTKTTSYVLLQPNGGYVGIATTLPTNDLSFGGDSDRKVWMERKASGAGNNLTLEAGGAQLGATDLNGGNLYLSSGIVTGTGTSNVYINAAGNNGTGTTSYSAATVLFVGGTGNVGVNRSAGFGNGLGVISILDAATNPSTNPLGGGILYSDAGAGKWRGSSGTTTTFGPAEPHCPTCGRDFVLEWQNEKTGHLLLCMWCLTEGFTRGVVRREDN